MTPPFLHVILFEGTEHFKDFTGHCMMRTKKEEPKVLVNEHNVVMENKAL